ncbi:MAG TPA: DNA polymerase III subunit gamma/tau [Patescibacteria group bacterium]|nr:DNA polymerase III subunit gamma/tau [Patescibacteria group bacterium]
MTYYRKYRPQKIADLDNVKLRETLTALLSGTEVPHAFLFTGPKGLGKTSTARIIAKVVNCENRDAGSVEPCNTCDSCISITNGSHIDILEIDGASNRGIDEIRDLREKVKLSPSHAKKKVYIIDEVHMLTTEAFNALLKTIEEPPGHVMFIFCTTEPQKVPGTIISRCFHIGLQRATEKEIIHSLERIIKGEDIKFKTAHDEKEILQEIAGVADGGFRDAAKNLEEIVAVSQGKEITKEKIEQMYKTHSMITYVFGFFHSLVKEDTHQALSETLGVVKNVADAGIDIKNFIHSVMETLHGLLLEKAGISSEMRLPEEVLSLEEIRELASLLSKAYQETKYAIIQPLPLELALVSWYQHVAQTMQSENLKQNGKMTMDDMVKKEKSLKVQQILKPQEKNEVKKTTGIKQEDLSEDKISLAHTMENVIYKIRPINHSLAGLLRSCTLIKVDGGIVSLQTAYKFHKEKILETKNILQLEKAMRELTGKDMQVVVELKK